MAAPTNRITRPSTNVAINTHSFYFTVVMFRNSRRPCRIRFASAGRFPGLCLQMDSCTLCIRGIHSLLISAAGLMAWDRNVSAPPVLGGKDTAESAFPPERGCPDASAKKTRKNAKTPLKNTLLLLPAIIHDRLDFVNR